MNKTGQLAASAAGGISQLAGVDMNAAMGMQTQLGQTYEVECERPRCMWLITLVGLLFGAPAQAWLQLRMPKYVAWRDTVQNLVVNTGLDDYLDKYYKGAAYTASHFVGLTDGTPTVAAADTMASHAGWAVVTDYSESVRQTLTMGSVSGQSVDNSASKASFSINGTATVGGAFVTTDSTKSGTSGTLVGAGAFTGGDKSVTNGDTLNVTITATQAAS